MKTQPPLPASARELLALNLKRLRAARGWSQDVLALEAGLDRTFVAHVERLKRNISLDNMEKLAIALCVPVECLLAVDLASRLRLAPGPKTAGQPDAPAMKLPKKKSPRNALQASVTHRSEATATTTSAIPSKALRRDATRRRT